MVKPWDRIASGPERKHDPAEAAREPWKIKYYSKQTTEGGSGTEATTTTNHPDYPKAKEWHREHFVLQGSKDIHTIADGPAASGKIVVVGKIEQIQVRHQTYGEGMFFRVLRSEDPYTHVHVLESATQLREAEVRDLNEHSTVLAGGVDKQFTARMLFHRIHARILVFAPQHSLFSSDKLTLCFRSTVTVTGALSTLFALPSFAYKGHMCTLSERKDVRRCCATTGVWLGGVPSPLCASDLRCMLSKLIHSFWWNVNRKWHPVKLPQVSERSLIESSLVHVAAFHVWALSEGAIVNGPEHKANTAKTSVRFCSGVPGVETW